MFACTLPANTHAHIHTNKHDGGKILRCALNARDIATSVHTRTALCRRHSSMNPLRALTHSPSSSRPQSRNMCLALNTLLGYTLERGSGSLTCCSSIFIYIYVFHREYKKTFSVLGIITQLCLNQSICTESRTLTHIY